MKSEAGVPSTVDLLARIPLFSRLGRRQLRKLADLCVKKDFEPGAKIVEEGGDGLGLFILVAGSAVVLKGSGDGTIHLADITAGDIIGEIALIDDAPRSASVEAAEPTECLLITRSSFEGLVRTDPEVAWCIVPALAERIRELQDKLTAEALRPGESGEPRSVTPDHPQPEDTDDGSAPAGPGLGVELARANFALFMAVAAGLRASTAALERAATTMADETEISADSRKRTILETLPKGLVAAVAAGAREAEKMPERMVASYRLHRRRGAHHAEKPAPTRDRDES